MKWIRCFKDLEDIAKSLKKICQILGQKGQKQIIFFPRRVAWKKGRWFLGCLMHHCIYKRIKRITFSTVRENITSVSITMGWNIFCRSIPVCKDVFVISPLFEIQSKFLKLAYPSHPWKLNLMFPAEVYNFRKVCTVHVPL